jgi:hypothetical protein
VAKGTRKVRALATRAKERIERLGKLRGAVIDVLDAAGGFLPLEELYARLHPDRSPDDRRRWRPRDLKRRTLPMLIEEGIVVEDGGAVKLTSDWLVALERSRTRGKEQEAEEVARKRFELGREAFANRHETAPDRAPTDGELAARREHFRATLEAKRRGRELEMRDRALEAFRGFSSGARKNLELAMNGELANVRILVQSVLAYHRVPSVRWKSLWERWKAPVLEAAAILAREHAPPTTSPADWKTHPLECECTACTTPEPTYARAWGAA